MTTVLRGLEAVPIEKLLPKATDLLKNASLEDLASILAGKGAAPRSADDLAPIVMALATKGSKLAAVERAVVLHAFATCGGNVSASARLLGIDRKAMERKLAKARRGG
jgi:ActR/RegA family two-component response regulator